MRNAARPILAVVLTMLLSGAALVTAGVWQAWIPWAGLLERGPDVRPDAA
jgi:hypothetical protein